MIHTGTVPREAAHRPWLGTPRSFAVLDALFTKTKGSALTWEFRATDAMASLGMRKNFVHFLHSVCTASSDVDAAELIFGELVTNVVRHAPGSIDIAVHVDASGAVRLDVCDTGAPFRYAPVLPAATMECGRGLFLVSQLADRVMCSRTDAGNKISVVLPVRMAKDSVDPSLRR